jgi:hypothetical protein
VRAGNVQETPCTCERGQEEVGETIGRNQSEVGTLRVEVCFRLGAVVGWGGGRRGGNGGGDLGETWTDILGEGGEGGGTTNIQISPDLIIFRPQPTYLQFPD